MSVAGATLAVAVAVGAPQAAARSSALSGEIAYLATKGNIYVINADGTGRRQLLSGVAMHTFNWSADGRLIAFTAGPWGHPGELTKTVIRIATADGRVVRTVPVGPLTSALEPTWSPNGQQLAFTGLNARAPSLDIYLINADGSGLRRLTRPQFGVVDENPDWSPDGRWIAFERYAGPVGRSMNTVMAVRPDGTGLHRIARVITGPQCACVDWSPDNSKIAYQASPTFATSKYPEIFVMNADGTGRTQLTRHKSRDENPDWSPDGQKIAFYSERWGNAEIVVIDADGSHATRVTRDPWYAALPRWRPTG